MRISWALVSSWLCALVGMGWGLADDASAGEDSRFTVASAASADERKFSDFVATRAAAIDTALGPLLEGACSAIRIEFARPSHVSYPQTGPANYDPERHVLTFRHGLVHALDNDLTPWGRSYWPYYQSESLRALMPVIGVVDETLWMTHLQEAAHHGGLTWPHAECASLDIAKRLGCQMLLAGASASLHSSRGQIFNANRIDLLWPENLYEPSGRSPHDDDTYRDVRRLGGLLLVRTLVAEFGVPRVLRHVARNPFHIENGNVRESALRYQERARRALEASAIN